ncbi:hypothetical protein AVEN_236040-1 [Araneus ventricosus]|uniref:Uncharacterized protein n=1 Tax=Araneus ventricosus TaxID=182803 RepID=A0A4Y2I572_ARAVE|nr:hypothetical protein AVEN_236040-1 [Araneus ventricosus]
MAAAANTLKLRILQVELRFSIFLYIRIEQIRRTMGFDGNLRSPNSDAQDRVLISSYLHHKSPFPGNTPHFILEFLLVLSNDEPAPGFG